ncbi:protein Wiz [Denticeps clupeoides]|uniref:protein Wiz n=1 Tax=Denticeps clupeoides TaxID=299321 RepID=UPI0010A32158|nr:protein Wiz-like [Denticeps clupeoides]
MAASPSQRPREQEGLSGAAVHEADKVAVVSSGTARKGCISAVKPVGTSSATSVSELLDSHTCELCGLCFETRRGLSSHARFHLRQLGVTLSESSGAPIDLLHQLIEDRDIHLPKALFLPPTNKKPKMPKTQQLVQSPAPKKDLPTSKKDVSTAKKDSLSHKKDVPGAKLKIKIADLVKKKHTLLAPVFRKNKASSSSFQGHSVSPSLSPHPRSASPVVKNCPPTSSSSSASSPSSSSSSSSSSVLPHAFDSRMSAESDATVNPMAPEKPLWAPQESDAPLNLMVMDPSGRDDVHVCELCGAWFETRKGLASHARAHLRQIGMDSEEAKGAAIEVLHRIIRNEGLKPSDRATLVDLDHTDKDPSQLSIHSFKPAPKRSSSPGSSKARPKSSSSSFPPVKRLKIASTEKLSLEDFSSKETELALQPPSGEAQGRPIVCEFCRETFVRNQSLSSHARSHLRQLGITEWTVKGSPMATLREVMAKRGVTSLPSPTQSPKPSQSPCFPGAVTQTKLPKARKGSRLVNKPKDEPIDIEVSPPPQKSFMGSWSSSTAIQNPTATPKTEQEALQPVTCEFCGETFDSRKALSCHSRAHLRQLGVCWPASVSPIDVLLQIMQEEGISRASGDKMEPVTVAVRTTSPWRKQGSSPRTFSVSPVDFSIKGPKMSFSEKDQVTQSAVDTICELCGLYFENRKALASHARAHLRQVGVDWHAIGSPIETLTGWIQREPGKVAELQKRYMRGDLPPVKKRHSCSPRSSSEMAKARSGSNKSSHKASLGLPHGSRAAREVTTASTSRLLGKGDTSHFSHKSHRGQGSTSAHADHSTHVARGGERRPPKHTSHTEGRSTKPSRSGNIPALVPRPPASPLVKVVGKVYSLKCRFCDLEFRGPLSVQEDWVRHLQQHILNLKRDAPPASPAPSPAPLPSAPLNPAAPILVSAQAV